ncbi:hypothetical protein NNRS527_01279 [Nitrosospira sp. NRS527]|nr:hypothetical protein NNRS527_01279 [Nitrosospira sp. NRS527]
MFYQQNHQAVALSAIFGMLAGVSNSTHLPTDLRNAWKPIINRVGNP